MSAIEELVHACGADEAALRHDALQRLQVWDGWLQPISETLPAGEDPAYDDRFMQMREEVNKLSGCDTAAIVQLAQSLLIGVSKDIRVITFYVWARLHQEGEAGLAEGLELLAAALHRLNHQLHPQRSRSRQAALAWLASGRMLDSLTLWPEADVAQLRRISGALLLMQDVLSAEDGVGLPPLMRALMQRRDHIGAANALPSLGSAEPTGVSDAHLVPISSGEVLKDQAKVLARYLRAQPDGWLSAHHLMKSVRWDTILHLPALGTDGNTRLPAPKADHRAHLKRLHMQHNWMTLLELTDALFGQAINHLWFDLQWYACEALRHQPQGATLVTILQQDLQGLLTRLPGIETLSYMDGTPFADEVTRCWMAQHVTHERRCTSSDRFSVGVAQEIPSLEQEAVAIAQAENIDAALQWLQAQPGISGLREQWLRHLLMARLCEQFGKREVALHLLDHLNQSAAQLTLAQWEPALLFEVRTRRLQLLRGKVAGSENERLRLQPEIDLLLKGLISLDPAKAAMLCN